MRAPGLPVWLEWTNDSRIKSVRLTPDGINGTLLVEAEMDGPLAGCTFKAEASFEGAYETEAEADADSGRTRLMLIIEEPKLWNVGEGNLYDLKLTLSRNGETLDEVKSYFGLRTISFDGGRCLINGKSVFQRLVLDQGFYPDGIYIIDPGRRRC